MVGGEQNKLWLCVGLCVTHKLCVFWRRV